MKTRKLVSTLVMVVLLSLAVAFLMMGAANKRSEEVTIKAGNDYDVAAGQCGLYLMNAPEDGVIKMERFDRFGMSLKFAKDVCGLSYKNSRGQGVHSFKGYLIKYVNLDKNLRKLWDAGDLAFYTKVGNKWTQCTATLVAGGEFGRLACWSKNFSDYGLVDVSIKEKDDDDTLTKHPKGPSGEAVQVGETVDVSSGNCGVFLSNAPAAGYADFERAKKGDYPLKFMKDVCQFTYQDAADNNIGLQGRLLISYINLDSNQVAMWEAGELAMYINTGRGWNVCDNAVMVYENGQERLCCMTSEPADFGLVDLSVKEKDDEAD